MLNREQLAWAAGLIDGEGSFYIQSKASKIRPDKPAYPRFEMSQVDPRVLQKLRDALPFGANIVGPYDNAKYTGANAQGVYVYYVSGFEDVQALMALVWIWLSPVKRQQAKSVLYGERP